MLHATLRVAGLLVLSTVVGCSPSASVTRPSPLVAEAGEPPRVPNPPSPANASGYDKPPQAILDVLHAPAAPTPYASPTRETILLVQWVTYPPIAQVAEPFLKLAGVRLEPRTH